MSFLVLLIPVVLKHWTTAPLGGKNGSKAMWKCSHCFHLYSRMWSAFHFHVPTSVSRQFSFPSAVRSCASENDCSLRWLHSVKGKHTLCPNLLIGLCVLFLSSESKVLRSEMMQLPWTCEQTHRAMKGVCSSSTRTPFFLDEETTKGTLSPVLQSNWSRGCLCTCLLSVREKEKAFIPLWGSQQQAQRHLPNLPHLYSWLL